MALLAMNRDVFAPASGALARARQPCHNRTIRYRMVMDFKGVLDGLGIFPGPQLTISISAEQEVRVGIDITGFSFASFRWP